MRTHNNTVRAQNNTMRDTEQHNDGYDFENTLQLQEIEL
jgi:hypothetical protein